MMQFLGIGNDIIEVARIEKSIVSFGDRFFAKLFTENEIAYCQSKANPALHFAGRFAAKEAIAKAIGSGFGKHLSWLDLEILNNADGKPVVHLSAAFKKEFPQTRLDISISHIKELASAVAIWIQTP